MSSEREVPVKVLVQNVASQMESVTMAAVRLAEAEQGCREARHHLDRMKHEHNRAVAELAKRVPA